MKFDDILTMILETLAMVTISGALAYLVGLPLGVLLNVTSQKGLKPCKWLNFVLSLIVNILRSIPCLIVVVLLMPTVRAILGKGTGEWYTIIIPLFVTSFGFVARMVEQSLAEVDKGKVEAVQSLGGTNFQIITKVLLPEARSSLIGGLAVTLVSLLGYTSFAYNISAGGIIAGIWRYYSQNTGDYLEHPVFWIMIIIVILLVQLIQELGLAISKKLDKRRILQ
ncbi:MAG: ABC transporter permease subunit [Clostridia bacterium]|nr:ABC transporter permease subunit [Clostridia bacterium]MBR2985568.1 ABC transporter permease subunit [Clostridia bacterium]